MGVVTRKFQITLPKDVREDMGIEIGDKVVFIKEKDGNYRLMTIDELTEEACRLCEDIEETIEESREGLGKGIEE